LSNAANRISALESDLDSKEPPRSGRRELSVGGNTSVIQWRAANSQVRQYQKKGGAFSTPEYENAFNSYLAGNDQRMAELQQVQNAAGMSSDLEEKGGYFITPEAWATELIKNVDNQVFVQKLAKVIMLPNGTRSFSVRVRKQKVSSFQWQGETTDTTPTIDTSLLYGKRTLTPNYINGSVVISRDLLRNVPSAEGMVMEEVAINLGETLEPALLTGDGNQKPLGLMTASTDGISTTRDVTSAATAFTFDDFVNQKFSLKLKYRNDAQWMLHRTILNQTALLKSGDGMYLWSPSRTVGEPDQILGLPVTETEWMPFATTSGLYYSLLGNFNYYWIVYELSMQMQRLIELRARTNENEYLFRAKLDGAPILEEAFVRGKRA
jgi:HK97 family phage major capsid protein